MSELKTLFRHSSHYLTGRVGLILLGFVSFPLFTRLFSVAEYGLISLAVKTVLIFTVLSKLGIQNSVLRFYEEHKASSDKNALRRYFSTLFFGTAGIAGFVTIVFAVTVWQLPAAWMTDSLKSLLVLASLLIFIRGMQSILGGFLRVEGRTKAFNVLEVATKATTIGLICLLLFSWNRSVRTFLLGTIVMEATAILVVIVFLLRRHLLAPGKFDLTFFRTGVRFGFPLIGYELASVILDSGDRILIHHFLGAQAVGLYSVAYNISLYIQESLMIPVNLALFPIYMKLWVSKGKEETQAFLSRSLNFFLMVAIGVVGVVILTSRDAVVSLASEKFQEAYRLLPILVVGLIVYAIHIFLNAGLLIYKKTGTMAKLVFYACGLNIVLNALLLPRMGIQGAALATLLSYVFLIVLMARASFALLPLKIEWAACGRYLLSMGLTVLVISPLELGNSFANLFTKGLLSLVVYAGILWVVDRRFRELASDVLGASLRRRQNSDGLSAADPTPAVKN